MEIKEKQNRALCDLSAGKAELAILGSDMIIGNVNFGKQREDIIFVVYTERARKSEDGKSMDVTRLISARYATNFERGLYYGKY